MVKVAGSFLKIQNDFEKIKELDRVCDLIHFDIMDGKFTEKATLSLNKMKGSILSLKKLFATICMGLCCKSSFSSCGKPPISIRCVATEAVERRARSFLFFAIAFPP